MREPECSRLRFFTLNNMNMAKENESGIGTPGRKKFKVGHPTELTRPIYVKRHGEQVRAWCYTRKCVVAKDECWNCRHNRRLHYSDALPALTCECEIWPIEKSILTEMDSLFNRLRTEDGRQKIFNSLLQLKNDYDYETYCNNRDAAATDSPLRFDPSWHQQGQPDTVEPDRTGMDSDAGGVRQEDTEQPAEVGEDRDQGDGEG